MISKNLPLKKLFLDKENPRFSYYDFKNEDEIIEYLLNFENLGELINSIKKRGYDSLGERLIVLSDDTSYIVLEGNRRVAALKHLNSEGYDSAQNISCDIVKERSEADYKISTKHIAGIRNWSAIDKRVYYKNKFEFLLSQDFGTNNAITELHEYSAESKTDIRRGLRQFYFVDSVYQNYKNPENKPLSKLSTDVVYGRIFDFLKNKLGLKISRVTFKVEIPDALQKAYSDILKEIAILVWARGILNTRTFDNLIKGHSNSSRPEYDNFWDLINNYQSIVAKLNETSDDESSSIENETEDEDRLKEIEEDESDKAKDIIRLIPIEETLSIDTLPYDLRKNVKLIINDKLSDQEVHFSSQSTGDLFFQKSIVEKPTKNGNYRIDVSFDDKKRSFNLLVNLKDIHEEIRIEDSNWFNEQISILLNVPQSDKLVIVLQQLNRITLSQDIDKLIATLLLRCLIEYSFDLYLDNFPPENHPTDLPQKCNYIKTHFINSNKTKNYFNREERKSANNISNVSNNLNPSIHSYKIDSKTNLIIDTFKTSKRILEVIYKELDSSGQTK